MAARLSFPLSFKRQLPAPLDVDTLFETVVDLEAYLSSAVRYPGQVASCLETEGTLYVMSNDLSRWIPVTGGAGEEGGGGAASVPIEIDLFTVAANTSVVAVDELSITDTLTIDGNLAVI